MQALQQHRIDVQEITGDDAMSLGGQKLTPGRAVAPRRGIDTGFLQDFPHGRMDDLVAQPG
jgi:hypothetical protein